LLLQPDLLVLHEKLLVQGLGIEPLFQGGQPLVPGRVRRRLIGK
jgi:hypothetical protein